MEIADNQLPIDLSRKCSYYESYTKPTSRPLPDLIPISALGSSSRDQKQNSSSFNDFQFKEQSKVRKELSRFRSVPNLPKSKISRLKSVSDSKICDTRSFCIRNVPSSYNGVERNNNQNSSFDKQTERFCWKRNDNESSHSMFANYTKQGPGVSLSTIQSLRKMLDKRKSTHS